MKSGIRLSLTLNWSQGVAQMPWSSILMVYGYIFLFEPRVDDGAYLKLVLTYLYLGADLVDFLIKNFVYLA